MAVVAIVVGRSLGGPGTLEYFKPKRLSGVVLAGFLGWFLAKSIAETRSFAWAWMIHFTQDVIIFTALFAVG